MTFRFQAKYGLLTYAQCGDLDPFSIVERLGDLGAECIVGREDHADGGIHLHAFFMFERKFSSRDVRVFDVHGRHPNVVRGWGTPEKGWDYATKYGDVVAGGLERPGSGLPEAGSVWASIILSEDRESFFEAVARLAPRALLCNFSSLRCYADWKYRREPEPYSHPGNISFDTAEFPGLDSWVQQNLVGHGYNGRHAYFGGLFCLDESVDDVDYAIFDDMQGGLSFFHAYKFWLGCQSQFYATDKYKGKKLIHWGRPSIYIANTNPFGDNGVDVDWLEGNCDIVMVDEPIFRASTE
uniref:Replication-associated protein n=1 Tax=Lorikeet Genomoviridae sp. TaxID=2814971 RepID=A0A8E7L4S3_9VIRU